MVKINLKESTELEFDMIIEGNMTKLDSLGLCIQGEEFDLKLPCTFSNSKISCRVPVLEGIIRPGEKNVALEVVIDGKVYKPFEQTVEFEKPLSIRSSLTMVEETVKSPSISMLNVSVKKADRPNTAGSIIPIDGDRLQKASNQNHHGMHMMQRNVVDLLEKVNDSKVTAKYALREAYVRVSQDASLGKLIMNAWSKMLKADGITIDSIREDKDALDCLRALDSVLSTVVSHSQDHTGKTSERVGLNGR